MGKLLFFLLVAVAVYLWLKKKRLTTKPPAATPPSPEAMVRCAWCGLHIPQSEGVQAGDRYYCGEEHRRLDGGERGS